MTGSLSHGRCSHWRGAFLALALGLALGGCRRGGTGDPGSAEVVSVNGEVLTRAEFERELSRELESAEVPHHSPEEVEPFKRALVDSSIERLLLLQSAKAHNIAVTPEEVDRGVLRVSSDFPTGNFHEALAQGQLSMEELKRKTAVLLTVEKLFAHHVYPRVAVTEEELRAAYAAHEADYQEPEQIRAAQLVVRELDEAKRLLAQLRGGAKFADLARKYSLSADARVGGDLGFFARGMMPPPFDAVVFSLDPGQLSDVVSTDYGFHLFRVLERRPARKRELSEVRGELEKRVLTEKRAAAQAQFLKDLRSKATVAINETTLQAIRAKPVTP